MPRETDTQETTTLNGGMSNEQSVTDRARAALHEALRGAKATNNAAGDAPASNRKGGKGGASRPTTVKANSKPKARKDGRDERESQSQILVEIGMGPDVELFHSPDRKKYASITVDRHRETYTTESDALREWLTKKFYQRTGRAPNKEAIASALNTINAHANYDGKELHVYLRIAERDGAIYVDLGDPEWRAIEVDKKGWRIDARPPVRFRRSPNMLPLPIPTRGSRVEELHRHLNISDDTFPLVVGWLLTALRGKGPFPLLAFTGEPGAGKSNAAKMVRSLIDPHFAPLRGPPRDLRDLAIAGFHQYILVFDNLSSMPAVLADALCRLSTGGAFATRKNWTDDEERVFQQRRAVVTTSINDVTLRSDLAERSIVVALDTIPDPERRTVQEVEKAFEEAKPSILGALLDAVSYGLAHEGEVHLDSLPRMADHIRWVHACEPGLGWETGRHLEAYARNRSHTAEIVLESDPVAEALCAYMAKCREFTGTATDLLNILTQAVSQSDCKPSGWPLNATAFKGHLKRLAPALRLKGISITPRTARI